MFADNRSRMKAAGLNPVAQAAVPDRLAEYERVPACVKALGALNRWPGPQRRSDRRLSAAVGGELW